MKSWKWIVVLMLGAALAAGAVGCGGDDDDDKANEAGKGSAGKGTAGKGGGAGEPAPGPDIPDGGVACGNTVCEPQEGSTVTLCCADAFAGKCGMMQGQSCVALVETDPRCPSVMAGGMFMLASCCTDDNMCGINTTIFGGSPCTELAEAAMMAMNMGAGMFITFPPAQACE